jgi:integrase
MKTPLSELFGLYLDRSNLAENSKAIKTRAIRYFVDWFGDLPADAVNYGHIEDYKSMLAKNRSARSANVYLQNIKPFFGWLVKRGYAEIDPFAGLSLYKIGETIKNVFTPDEIERLLYVSDLRWKVAVSLGLCGLRRAEVLNLTIADINFDQGFVYIREKNDSAETWAWQIKEYNQSLAPFPELIRLQHVEIPLHALTTSLIESVPAGQPYLLIPPKYYRLLMNRKANGTLNYSLRNSPWPNFSRSFTALLKRALITDKSFHDLRRTLATEMSQHLTLTETQKLMRHSAASTTAKYYIKVDREALIGKTCEILKDCFARAAN